ncbi:MAG: diguanylate cyclase [Clostridia bacterium]|nr:diguanylate cyclase [Clostridia bacterium]
MINTNYIVIIDDEGEVINLAKEIFKEEKGVVFVHTSSAKDDIKRALMTMPDLIIINADNIDADIFKTCQFIRKDKDSNATPIIVTADTKDEEFRMDILKSGVEYYIPKPLHEGFFYYTIKNLSRLIASNRCISALTGLPGNIQIESELKRRIASRKTYAVLYADLDNFKSYNDKYGFMSGDEVIKFTSNVMQDNIQKYGKQGDFLGHIGGDDFVAILDYENARKIARSIIKEFDEKILDFYTDEDIKNGGIRIANRRGKIEKFPIMTITVAMISNKYRKYKSTLEIGEDGASVKKKAKTIEGSTFLENRRKTAMNG